MSPGQAWSRSQVESAALGRRIRTARKAAGLTQAEVAGAHASAPYISRIEAGQRHPSHQVLAAIAEKLDLEVGELTAAPGDDPHSDLCVVLAQAELDLRRGSTASALAGSTEAVTRADSADLRAIGDQATLVRGSALLGEGDPAAAIAVLLQRFGNEVDQITSVRVLTLLSKCRLSLGEIAEAVRIGERGSSAVETYQLHGLPEALDHAATFASSLVDYGEPLRAAQVCRDAIKQGNHVGTHRQLADAYLRAGIAEASAGTTSDAAMHMVLAEAALEIATRETYLEPLQEQLDRALVLADRRAF